MNKQLDQLVRDVGLLKELLEEVRIQKDLQDKVLYSNALSGLLEFARVDEYSKEQALQDILSLYNEQIKEGLTKSKTILNTVAHELDELKKGME